MPPAIGRSQKAGLLMDLNRGGGGKWYDTWRSGGSRGGGTKANRLEVESILQGEGHGVKGEVGPHRASRLA